MLDPTVLKVRTFTLIYSLLPQKTRYDTVVSSHNESKTTMEYETLPESGWSLHSSQDTRDNYGRRRPYWESMWKETRKAWWIVYIKKMKWMKKYITINVQKNFSWFYPRHPKFLWISKSPRDRCRNPINFII